MKKLLLSLPFFIITQTNQAQILDFSNPCMQEQTKWCWAAVSQCVLGYYNHHLTQCEIAEYARNVTWHDFGSDDCCQNPGGPCNHWNYNWGHRGSIQDILVHFAQLNNTGVGSALSLAQVQEQLGLNRPFIIRWGWAGGGGHFIVGHGINGQTLYYMDPWMGEGAKIANYDWVVSLPGRHTWTHTNIMSSSPTGTSISAEVNETTTVRIYPNPSDGLIDMAVSENSIVRIFDLLGRQIGVHFISVRSNLQLNLSSGVYLIHVESGEKISTHKVVVQ